MAIVTARVGDATHLELAEPIATHQREQVLVSVAELGDEDMERAAWLSLFSGSLGAAYGEAEPNYARNLVREPNPEYKG